MYVDHAFGRRIDRRFGARISGWRARTSVPVDAGDMTATYKVTPDRGAPDRLVTPWGERWRIIVFCLVAWTISNLDQSLFGYAIPDILRDFDADLSAIGYILAISFAVAAVLVSFGGWAADRYGRRAVLVALLASSALFVGIQATAETLPTLTFWRALAFGLSGGLASVTAAYIAEAAPPRLRGLLIGVLQCGYPLGWFLASLLAGPLLATHGWRPMFLFGFAVIPLAFLIGWKLPESRHFMETRRTGQGSGPDRGGLAELFGPQNRRTAVLCCLIFFAYGSAYAGTAFFFPTYFTQARGYTPSGAAYLVGLSYGIAALGYLGAAFVGEFVTTRRNTTALWSALGAVALVALLWLPRTTMHDKVLFALTTTFFFGVNGVLPTLLTELFPTRIRATAYAVCGSAALSIGFAVYPMVVPAAVAALGWQWALSLAIAPLLLLVSGLTLLLPNLRSGIEVTDLSPPADATVGADAAR
jgi:MFS family permease